MPSFKSSGLSLANKCQLLFGLAVVLILTAALSVPWLRMQGMVDAQQFEIARQQADAFVADGGWGMGDEGETPEVSEELTDDEDETSVAPGHGPRVMHFTSERIETLEPPDSFLYDALTTFRRNPQLTEHQFVERSGAGPARYRYARAVRESARAETIEEADADGVQPQADDRAASMNGEAPFAVLGIVLVERDAALAVRDIFINRTYILLSGALAGVLAIAVFYVITTRLILSPVRILRETAERVSRGDLHVRSDIRTGDEFEELSETFNLMLANLKSSQDQLRQVNKGLDLKLNELAESNVLLEQANRLKSEFLANVSHELRTPLNAILGFAEVVQELEEHGPPEAHERRRRYLSNIIVSGRNLLDLINDLLDLAKIEAGRLEIYPEPTNVNDVCDGLVTLIRPQAEKKPLDLTIRISPSMPVIETDPGRFQQILFNFLSNAVKFTPEGGSVTLTAERLRSPEGGEEVCISVRDTGPGIGDEDQKIIFEKFRQVDASHTRRHSGTGLGLAICKELATLLGGRITLESELGHGSTFSLHLPLRLVVAQPQSLMSAT